MDGWNRGMRRPRPLAALLATAALLAVAPAAQAAWPNKMAAMGDSYTEATATCAGVITCMANSWSTGTNTDVNSHYLRIKAVNSAITDNKKNVSVHGEKAIHLERQANDVVAYGAEYVTILMGHNDACSGSDPALMTPVSTYKAQYQKAIDILKAGLPNAKVVVASNANVYHLWEILHHNLAALSRWASGWDLGGICQTLLKNASSHKTVDEDRRRFVRQRIIDYNQAAKEVCATWSRCLYDNDTLFNYKFTTDMVSTQDYFHPNIKGQATTSSVGWGIVTANGWLQG